MKNKLLVNVTGGLATLGPEALRIMDLLDWHFLKWAVSCNAERMLFPPLMRVRDLDRFDYFQNFPHLGLIVSRIQATSLADYAARDTTETIPNDHLTSGEYALPSAACYNVYLHLSNTVLEAPQYITTVARCFRNEEQFAGLQRLWGFTMREIVCVGPVEAVREHLAVHKQRILDFAHEVGLSLELQVATDPFYDRQGSRALVQQLFPVKEEFVYNGTTAVASVNFHRNFFGERCNIRTSDGGYAFTSCVAFGIERWVYTLMNRFGGDVEAIYNALHS